MICGKRTNILCTCLLIFSCHLTQAYARCGRFPPSVEKYVAGRKEWLTLGLDDLPDDDKFLWNKYHSQVCPGFSPVNFYGGHRKTYALAMISADKNNLQEILLILEDKNGAIVDRTLSPPQKITTPRVIWRVPPGIFYNRAMEKNVIVVHDSIVYEKMEASAIQFYSQGGKLMTLLSAD